MGDKVCIRELLCGGEEGRPIETREHTADEGGVEIYFDFVAGLDVKGERVDSSARALEHVMSEETHD